MRIRNISNQSIPLRRTGPDGGVLDTLIVAPGDNDVHELWLDTIKTSPFAHLMTDKPQGEYAGATVPKISEPRPPTGEPSSAVKHDDMPAGSPPHPGRPHPGKSDEDEDEAKKKTDEKGPGTRRRDG